MFQQETCRLHWRLGPSGRPLQDHRKIMCIWWKSLNSHMVGPFAMQNHDSAVSLPDVLQTHVFYNGCANKAQEYDKRMSPSVIQASLISQRVVVKLPSVSCIPNGITLQAFLYAFNCSSVAMVFIPSIYLWFHLSIKYASWTTSELPVTVHLICE